MIPLERDVVLANETHNKIMNVECIYRSSDGITFLDSNDNVVLQIFEDGAILCRGNYSEKYQEDYIFYAADILKAIRTKEIEYLK